MIQFERVLVVAAHPDDEVLGCGGTLAHLAAEGVELHVALLADGVGSRYGTEQRPDAGAMPQEREQRRDAARRAADILGICSVTFDDFPDNRMDTVPLLAIAQSIEAIIERLKPDTIFTHHAGDVNVDHRRIHEAITSACRPQPGHCVRNILCFEVPSSTEWQFPHSNTIFLPNLYVGLSEAHCGKKRRALECYAGEMRLWPHARSVEGVETATRKRGVESGMDAAEAFMIVRVRTDSADARQGIPPR
jgi:LmbE family N-acetylglucosaminyl deacetylase